MKPHYMPIAVERIKTRRAGIAFKLAQMEKTGAICAMCQNPLKSKVCKINLHSSCKQKFLREHYEVPEQ